MATEPLQHSLFELLEPAPEPREAATLHSISASTPSAETVDTKTASRPQERSESPWAAGGRPIPALPSRCQVPPALWMKVAALGADLGAFVAALDRHLRGRLERVTLTDNRSRILSARPVGRRPVLGRPRLALRIHWGFALAPDPVLAEVATFLDRGGRRRKRALAALREHFEAFTRPRDGRDGAEPPRRRRRPVLRPRGAHHDLAELCDEINGRYFGGRLEVGITWGRRPTRKRRRTIHLGTYDHEQRVIRIHRHLDHPRVPRVVVASVVHHELLHAAMPAETVRGRRRIHPPEFRRRERGFEGFREAEAWIRANLPWLLGGRRTRAAR